MPRRMTIPKIEAALKAFFKQHATDTFCALAIDAGYLCLNTEAGFETRRQRYSARWEAQTKPVTVAEARKCKASDRDTLYPSLAFNLGEGETFTRALAIENESRAEQRDEGNPYAKRGSDDWTSLRFGPGDFAYQQLIDLGLDDEYQAHYERNQPKTSPYAKHVRAIVAALKAHDAKLFAGVKRSKDFRIYAVDHAL